MKKSSWRAKRSFGPVVEVHDGILTAHCSWCVFRVGDACTHVRPSRRMTDLSSTPEWCELRDQMIKDVERSIAEASPLPVVGGE